MVNFNGVITEEEQLFSASNRSFLYGDGVFETLKIVNNTIISTQDKT